MQMVLQALILMWRLNLTPLILGLGNKAVMVRDQLPALTLLSLLKEQIFASKARAALYVLIHIALVATAMCQLEVRLQLILGTHQPILILFILMMTITMAPIGPR